MLQGGLSGRKSKYGKRGSCVARPEHSVPAALSSGTGEISL